MSTFSRTPRTLKGAIVGIDSDASVPASVIVFQYNPDTLTRTLQPQTAGDSGDRMEALRLKGAPIETLKLEAEIDATEDLENGDELATAHGIFPQLSALETLVYPKSALVVSNTTLLSRGTIEVMPPTAPFTLFIWGAKRVLPVRLVEFSITEEAYDINLNPIRARVSLGMRVLSYNDLSYTHPGYALFLSHQVVKETLAGLGSTQSLNGVLPAGVKLF